MLRPGLNSSWMDLQTTIGLSFFVPFFCYAPEWTGSHGAGHLKDFPVVGFIIGSQHLPIHGMATSVCGRENVTNASSMGELTVVSFTGPDPSHSLSWKNKSYFIPTTTRIPTTFNEIPQCTIRHAL